MRRNLFKSMVVLVALAVLVLVPVVEANYMVGYPYVGTSQRGNEVRRWALSGFYDGRELPLSRDRTVKRYFTDGREGRSWLTSTVATGKGEGPYWASTDISGGRRCLGCEIGAYSLEGPQIRRGRYYYTSSRVAGMHFIYTGVETAPTTTLGTTRRITTAPRSRLLLGEADLAKLHEEAASMLGTFELKSGRRCLSCQYVRPRIGRYYTVTSPLGIARLEKEIPLYE